MAKPLMVAWEITPKCNLKCEFCCNPPNYAIISESFNKNKIRLICKELVNNGTKLLSITGGEPTLSPYLPMILETLCNFDFKIFITTNGIWEANTDKLLSILKKYTENDITIQFSIEGREKINDSLRGKGSYKKLIETTKRSIREGLNTSFMLTAMESNYKELFNIKEITEELGIRMIGVERFVPTGRGNSLKREVLSPISFKELFKLIKRLNKDGNTRIFLNDPIRGIFSGYDRGGCMAGIAACAIDVYGNIIPCTKLRIPAGNIFETALEEIWSTSEIFNKLRKRSLLKGKCKNCKFLYNCGGCRALAYAYYRDFLQEDIGCWINI